MHDPRVGRFFAVDPLTHEYPWYSPYQFSGNRVMDMVELEGLEPKKKSFWSGFGESVAKGILQVVNYATNNPNHSGYGYNPNMKPPTKEDFARYEINWKSQIDPYYHIDNFSKSLVFGTSDFVMGIYYGDGEKTAKSIPNVVSAYGSMFGLARLSKSLSIKPNIFQGVSRSKLIAYGEKILESSGKKPYVISAVTDSKTGKTFMGTNRTIKSLDDVNDVLKSKLPKETLEKWSTYNCAECDAYNNALNAGAKWENLTDMHTMKLEGGKYVDFARCDNCKVTFKDKKPTSENGN
ncbi:hypothetical protein BZL53_14530 [Flavobacterium columnare]|nr:hypothetical protein BZL53_14530 [Flavobacterium columnare]